MITATYVHYGQRAARLGPDGTCRIRLLASDSVPFFQRGPGSYCAKPARIRSGWPGQVWAKRIWSGSKPGCTNHPARFLAEPNRSATSFLLSDSVAFFHRRPGSFCAQAARIYFGSESLCQALAKRIRSGKKRVYKNHRASFWPTLQSRPGSDPAC